MNVCFVAADLSGVGFYRAMTPSLALKRLGHTSVVTTDLPHTDEGFDVVVVGRTWADDKWWRPWVEKQQALGRKVFCEIDDDYWMMDKANPGYEFWNAEPDRLVNLAAFISACDGATTTTVPLARTLSSMTNRVEIVPNLLLDDTWDGVERVPDKRFTVVGWAGGAAHLPDMPLITGAVEDILTEKGVAVRLSGIRGYPFEPHPRMRTLHYVTIDRYPSLIANFDIGLSPLLDTRFNRAKSDLKFIEYARLKIPGVFSGVAPYLDAVEHGKDGFIARTDKDWRRYVRLLVQDSDLRAEMGARAYLKTVKRMVSTGGHLWEKALGLAPV